MDEALNLADYLPMSFRNPGEQEYISFLWEAFETNYETGKYQFAFLAYHMLMMSFVYFNIWQIREARPDDFEKGLIGFARDDETTLLRATSPFAFSKVNERTILRLFRLVGCDDSRIGNYRKLVDDRNDAAHANGNIFFNTQHEADAQIRQVIRAVEEIQTYSRPVINRRYQEFLLQSHNPEEREYLDADDQIREVLIHGNYMSRNDIEICINFDLSTLGDDNGEAINSLHNALCEAYGSV
ncbi:MAG: hypothetical protein OXR67_02110 [Chloroflexota bacterium]|nr:hypothetical protein [Chloroflexota bacterium]